MILNKSDYTPEHLWELITKQILEGDYTNHDLLIELIVSDTDIRNGFQDQKREIEQQASTNSNAQYLTAIFAPDLLSRISLFDKAIEMENTKAMIFRAMLYLEDSDTLVTKVDKLEGFKLLERAIELGDSEAMFVHAVLKTNRAHNKYTDSSLKFKKAVEEAILLLETAIQLENPKAMLECAKMHSDKKWGIFNLAKAIWLYEKAERYGCSDPELGKRYHSMDQEVAQDLLKLIWDELIAGQPFSSSTISNLSAYCKDTIISRLKDAPQGSSLRFLKALKDNPHHPLCLILNNGKTDVMSEEFKSLMNHARSVVLTRETFFKLQSNSVVNLIPAEVEAHILSFLDI